MDIENFLKYFEEKFIEIRNSYSDNREFGLLEIGEKGNLHAEVSRQRSFCFSCHYNEDIIEIYYDRNRIITKYIHNQLNLSNEQIQEEIQYLASHEYGHALFCESSKKLREINANWKLIYVKYEKFNCFVFLNVFSEFFADLEAFKIGITFPEIKFQAVREYFVSKLRVHSTTILPTLLNFKYGRNKIDNYQSSFLTNLSFIYAFNKYNDYKRLFEENQLSELFQFLGLIFDYFRRVINSISDLDLRRNKISELLKILNEYYYDDLVLKNKLSPDLQSQLKELLDKDIGL